MNKEIYIKKSMVPFNSTANVKIKTQDHSQGKTRL